MSVSPVDIPGFDAGSTDAGQAGLGGPGSPKPEVAEKKKATYRSQMARANVVLILLFIGGGALIYGLSLRKGPAEASAEQKLAEEQVKSFILRLGEQASGGGRPVAGGVTRRLLKTFCAEVTDRQIPLSQLKKDPFVFVPPRRPRRKGTRQQHDAGPKPAENDPQKETLERAIARFEALELQSIMMGQGEGQRSAAIISNNLLTVGQKVEGFTVKSIKPKKVVLAWQDKEFTLEMPYQE